MTKSTALCEECDVRFGILDHCPDQEICPLCGGELEQNDAEKDSDHEEDD